MSGKLFIVPTPIGNLEDMSFRAIKVLRDADLILAEDTRTSSKLLKHFDITTSMRSYHKFNEHQLVENLCQEIQGGATYALISDAGTPGISDPAYLLVKHCIEREIEVSCLPGATAFVPALVCSGLPVHEFIYWGFLPQKKGRQTKLLEALNEEKTGVLYESPHRIHKLVRQIAEIDPNRILSISREISKMYEETLRGNALELAQRLEEKPIKGEIVLVIQAKDAKV